MNNQSNKNNMNFYNKAGDMFCRLADLYNIDTNKEDNYYIESLMEKIRESKNMNLSNSSVEQKENYIIEIAKIVGAIGNKATEIISYDINHLEIDPQSYKYVESILLNELNSDMNTVEAYHSLTFIAVNNLFYNEIFKDDIIRICDTKIKMIHWENRLLEINKLMLVNFD